MLSHHQAIINAKIAEIQATAESGWTPIITRNPLGFSVAWNEDLTGDYGIDQTFLVDQYGDLVETDQWGRDTSTGELVIPFYSLPIQSYAYPRIIGGLVHY